MTQPLLLMLLWSGWNNKKLRIKQIILQLISFHSGYRDNVLYGIAIQFKTFNLFRTINKKLKNIIQFKDSTTSTFILCNVVPESTVVTPWSIFDKSFWFYHYWFAARYNSLLLLLEGGLQSYKSNIVNFFLSQSSSIDT